MNKKFIIGIAAAALILMLVCTRSCGDKHKVPMNSVAHANPDMTLNQPKAVDIYVDASGSMKGYVDKISGTFKKNIPDLTTNLMNNNSLGLADTAIRCFTINNGTVKPYETKAFCNDISNTRLFNAGSTEVHKMFDLVAERVIADSSHVGILVTDGILSFPNCRNTEKNIVDIAILQYNVTRSMTRLVNNNLSVAIVQYFSDFNGNYYYNYRDNVLSAAKGQTMKDRPYYLILVGSKCKIESMFSKNVLPKGYKGIYMFNKDCTRPVAHVVRAQRSGVVSDVKDDVVEVRVEAQGEPAYFYLAVQDFYLPSFVDVKTMDKPQTNGVIVSKVEKVTFNDVKNDNQLRVKTPIDFTYLYKVTLKNNEQLCNIADLKDEIYFVSESFDVERTQIDNDNVEDLTALEGRTFMFDSLIQAINKAYISQESRVAVVDVNITKWQK